MGRIIRRALKFVVAVVVAAVVFVFVLHIASWVHRRRLPPAERLIADADQLAEEGNWLAAAPLYKRAELIFHTQGNASRELYTAVSQIPAGMESAPRSMSDWLALLDNDLALPAAADARTRLRILQIKGQIENNYDAALAHETWTKIRGLAISQHDYQIANRAYGEDAIPLYILGDIADSRKQAVRAYVASRFVFHDRGAQIRLASLIGTGMVESEHYQDGIRYLDAAISLAKATPNAGYPSLAIDSKINALRGLKRFDEALTLWTDAIPVPQREHLRGHLYQLLETRAQIYQDMGKLPQATRDYAQAAEYARELGYWRGLTEVDGPLARAYENDNQLDLALTTINEALDANRRIPREMYFGPRNLAIKAEILKKLGRVANSNNLYEGSLALVDSLLIGAPTVNIVNTVLTSFADVYSGYFASLCEQGDFAHAFAVIERAHGRLETEALQNHKHLAPHPQTPQERMLTELNLKLIATEDPSLRRELLTRISAIEDQLDPDPWAHAVATRPIALHDLQSDLLPREAVIEYVLANPVSYALAITHASISVYTLPPRRKIVDNVHKYVTVLNNGQEDRRLAHKLFKDLIEPIRDYSSHESIIFVPDSDLNSLPMAALYDGAQYLTASHTTSTVSAGTVLHMLRSRASADEFAQPFMGVAPWSDESSKNKGIFTALLNPFRTAGPERTDFVPLPESKHEVETGRDEVDTVDGAIPSSQQLLLGGNATESHFKSLPLQAYQVIHLALHGYADLEHPDRSALVFAPEPDNKTEDGLLQIREIRRLALNASLVIVSACKTGVGPAGEGGIENLSSAFLQAGAQTVISTYWAVKDQLQVNSWACSTRILLKRRARLKLSATRH
jgi:CHAT domain-containing protein